MMNVFAEKILGSPFTWAPSAVSGHASPIAIDLQASRQLWKGHSAR